MTEYQIAIILATLFAGFGGLAVWMRSLIQDKSEAAAQRSDIQARLIQAERDIEILKKESQSSHRRIYERPTQIETTLAGISTQLRLEDRG